MLVAGKQQPADGWRLAARALARSQPCAPSRGRQTTRSARKKEDDALQKQRARAQLRASHFDGIRATAAASTLTLHFRLIHKNCRSLGHPLARHVTTTKPLVIAAAVAADDNEAAAPKRQAAARGGSARRQRAAAARRQAPLNDESPPPPRHNSWRSAMSPTRRAPLNYNAR